MWNIKKKNVVSNIFSHRLEKLHDEFVIMQVGIIGVEVDVNCACLLLEVMRLLYRMYMFAVGGNEVTVLIVHVCC